MAGFRLATRVYLDKPPVFWKGRSTVRVPTCVCTVPSNFLSMFETRQNNMQA